MKPRDRLTQPRLQPIDHKEETKSWGDQVFGNSLVDLGGEMPGAKQVIICRSKCRKNILRRTYVFHSLVLHLNSRDSPSRTNITPIAREPYLLLWGMTAASVFVLFRGGFEGIFLFDERPAGLSGNDTYRQEKTWTYRVGFVRSGIGLSAVPG